MRLTPRQRVFLTLEHREPDCVPFNLRPGPEILECYRQRTGRPADAGDFAEHFGHDVRYVSLPSQPCPPEVPVMEWTPCPTTAEIAGVAAAARALQQRGLAVCGSYQCGVYEQAKHWLGDEAAMVAPYENPVAFAGILDRILEWKLAVYGAYAVAGTDIVWMGDDLGTQRSLVMSPALYREWYRPRHQRIAAHIRALNPAAKIAFHCCGHVTPLIPNLIELGIDILEAVQSEAMDLVQLKREFGHDLAFWGGIGAQSVLRGTPAQVQAGVRSVLRIMTPGGGYIAAPCHTLTEEVPWENVLAFHAAMKECGTQPTGPAG